MSNNRHLISDFDIVRPAQLLDKGIPLPGLRGHYVVDEGWCAVITEGGAFKEILEPGHHYLDRYRMFRDVKAIAVDMRVQPLSVSTRGEFQIAQPVPVEVNLDLTVEYQVVDARRVALEVKTPLTSLYDRVIQAIRGAVSYVTIDEIRTQGEGLAHVIQQRLQAMNLPKVLGIEVLNVLVTTIKATDVGADVIARQKLTEYTTVRNWQVDSMMTQNSRVTWEWLVLHRPELAQQYLVSYGEIAKEMVDKGLLDPAGMLNQPATGMAGQTSPMGFLPPFMSPGGSQAQPVPQLAAQDPIERMREEKRLLETGLIGASVELRAMQDSSGLLDGSYAFKVTYPRSSGGQIALFIRCPKGYPGAQAAPIVEVEVDGEPMPFQSAIARRWTGQLYLVEIAREVKQQLG